MVSVSTHQLLNTLYVMTEGSFLRMDHDTIKIEADGKMQVQVPLHHLCSVVCFGRVSVSTAVIERCAEDGRELVFMSRSGRFKARVVGPTSGNVLLRMAQHRKWSDEAAKLEIARAIVAGKVKNARQVLLRGARESTTEQGRTSLGQAADRHAKVLTRLPSCEDLDHIRGREGEAAQAYFAVFDHLVRPNADWIRFEGRNRRPPRDPVNALLSFVYALLLADCVGALESVGLDPQLGYLHSLRPGRPGLALDLQEELRSIMADRLSLSLINRKQVRERDFKRSTGGAVKLTDEIRRKVIVAYQRRKSESVRHRVVDRLVPLGLIPQLQAKLMARHLRGDLEYYVPHTQ